uniref:Uncharacterized protein n=1 Tax=Anguilla anguilla TaxID=7936 RepID=A0A0E9UEC6_ANGAN
MGKITKSKFPKQFDFPFSTFGSVHILNPAAADYKHRPCRHLSLLSLQTG